MWIQPILQRPSQRTKGETVPQKMVGTLGKTYRTTQKAQLCCISSIGSAFVYEFFNRGSSPGGGFFNNRQPHTFMSNYLSFIIKKHMWLALSGPTDRHVSRGSTGLAGRLRTPSVTRGETTASRRVERRGETPQRVHQAQKSHSVGSVSEGGESCWGLSLFAQSWWGCVPTSPLGSYAYVYNA